MLQRQRRSGSSGSCCHEEEEKPLISSPLLHQPQQQRGLQPNRRYRIPFIVGMFVCMLLASYVLTLLEITSDDFKRLTSREEMSGCSQQKQLRHNENNDDEDDEEAEKEKVSIYPRDAQVMIELLEQLDAYKEEILRNREEIKLLKGGSTSKNGEKGEGDNDETTKMKSKSHQQKEAEKLTTAKTTVIESVDKKVNSKEESEESKKDDTKSISIPSEVNVPKKTSTTSQDNQQISKRSQSADDNNRARETNPFSTQDNSIDITRVTGDSPEELKDFLEQENYKILKEVKTFKEDKQIDIEDIFENWMQEWNKLEEGQKRTYPNALMSSYKNSSYQVSTATGRSNDSNIDEDDVTMVVHCGASPSKLERLHISLERFKGPLSAAIILSSITDIEQFQQSYLNHDWGHQTHFHVVIAKPIDGMLCYPHNSLRQLALENRKTNYFLTLDVDFVTTPTALDTIRRTLGLDDDKDTNNADSASAVATNTILKAMKNDKTLMVLPAFDYIGWNASEDRYFASNFLPQTSTQIQTMMTNESMDIFHSKFRVGHGSTNFTKWFDITTDRTKTKPSSYYFDIEYENGFEPYVLGYSPINDKENRHNRLPTFWECFCGFGRNKISWFREAHWAGFQFGTLTLPDLFVVHMGHKISDGRLSQYVRFQDDEFNGWLRDKYWQKPEEKADPNCNTSTCCIKDRT